MYILERRVFGSFFCTSIQAQLHSLYPSSYICVAVCFVHFSFLYSNSLWNTTECLYKWWALVLFACPLLYSPLVWLHLNGGNQPLLIPQSLCSCGLINSILLQINTATNYWSCGCCIFDCSWNIFIKVTSNRHNIKQWCRVCSVCFVQDWCHRGIFYYILTFIYNDTP